LGRYEEALESFRKAIEIEPSLAEAHYGAGEALRMLGKDEQAKQEYRKAGDLDPRYNMGAMGPARYYPEFLPERGEKRDNQRFRVGPS
jgi:tetratricopeptide (TPR) repeat protein